MHCLREGGFIEKVCHLGLEKPRVRELASQLDGYIDIVYTSPMYGTLRKSLSLGILFAFLVNVFVPMPLAQADQFLLPKPGVMVHLSPAFNPPILKGIKVNPNNPFRFEFILDQGDSKQNNDELKQESAKLIKYFLASLTIPEKDLWVTY